MTDDKVIHIYDWRRPLKNGEPLCAMPIDNRAVINPEAYQKGDQRVLTILARCKRLQFLIVAGVVTLIAIGAVRWF
jgi:hypothetical protein